ncbi:unnamed protein product [Trichobilharzia regenti]|nr:unnamed protein product [Trichobilharzia regenti]
MINIEFLIKSIMPKFINLLNCSENPTIKQLIAQLKSTVQSIKGLEEEDDEEEGDSVEVDGVNEMTTQEDSI